MTKIKIESYKTKEKIPVQRTRMGQVALIEDPKDARRKDYKPAPSQDHGSRQAARRAELYDEITNVSSAELLEEANNILAQNGFDEDGQKFPERELVFNTEDYDIDDEAAGAAKTQELEALMGSNYDLDELIRSSRISDRHRREKSATLADNPDNDPEEYALDGFNVKEERPNQ